MLKALKKHTDETRRRDIDKGIVGYALFDMEKRAFMTFRNIGSGPFESFVGNIEDAYIADSREEALDKMITMLDDYFDVKIVPLISNNLFGLSPAPGSLESCYDEFD